MGLQQSRHQEAELGAVCFKETPRNLLGQGVRMFLDPQAPPEVERCFVGLLGLFGFLPRVRVLS